MRINYKIYIVLIQQKTYRIKQTFYVLISTSIKIKSSRISWLYRDEIRRFLKFHSRRIVNLIHRQTIDKHLERLRH